MKIDIENKEFLKAYELIEKTNQSLFITGKAGTGKSAFIKYIIKTIPKKFIVLAPTGIASNNIKGVTIHSFFQFPLRPLLLSDKEIKVFGENNERRKLISHMDTLIIDEISMTSADLIDGIDYSLRMNGGRPNMPFGGKQVIFIGDLFQLEPVRVKIKEQVLLNDIYKNLYFYNAKVFDKFKLITIEFNKVYRQSDKNYIKLLDKIRRNEISQVDIDEINKRVLPKEELNKQNFTITLSARTSSADKVNSYKLEQLKSKSFNYCAEITGEFEKNKYPTDSELILKVGAQVIFIRNDNEKRWVNGTLGQVYELTDSGIKVILEDGSIHIVEKQEWENIRYQYNKNKKKITQEIKGTFKQFPLKLAWAITIHKSQGLTLEKVVVDISGGSFASGQTYVALSRISSIEDLFLKQKLKLNDIRADNEILEFSKTFSNCKIIDEIIEFGKREYELLIKQDFESIGKLYFVKATDSLIAGDFRTAYNYFLFGFDFVTCDCHLYSLMKNNKYAIDEIFNTTIPNCKIDELDLIRAIFYFFTENFTLALAFINSFLSFNDISEIGYYLKGRVLMALRKKNDAISQMNYALSINETARCLYRLGRYENASKESKLDNLVKSFILNSSSNCCYDSLWESANKNEIKIEANKHKYLANCFNNIKYGQSWIIDIVYRKNNLHVRRKMKKAKFPIASDVIPDFIESLKSDFL